jgi:hypothetical protein
MAKHEEACANNQHIFIPFAFDPFGFLASTRDCIVNLLKIVQNIMHINIVSLRSMIVVFQKLDFGI